MATTFKDKVKEKVKELKTFMSSHPDVTKYTPHKGINYGKCRYRDVTDLKIGYVELKNGLGYEVYISMFTYPNDPNAPDSGWVALELHTTDEVKCRVAEAIKRQNLVFDPEPHDYHINVTNPNPLLLRAYFGYGCSGNILFDETNPTGKLGDILTSIDIDTSGVSAADRDYWVKRLDSLEPEYLAGVYSADDYFDRVKLDPLKFTIEPDDLDKLPWQVHEKAKLLDELARALVS